MVDAAVLSVMDKVSKADIQKAQKQRKALKANPEVTPGDPALPSLNLIWPMVMSAYEQLKQTGAAVMPHSSAQVQSDFALGVAVITVCTPLTSQPTSPWFYQALVLLDDTIGNRANIMLLPFPPPSLDLAPLELWFRQQVPDLTPADLFPTGKNGIGDYIAWGMACRQMLIGNGWDVSGISGSTSFPINKDTLYVNGRFLCGRHGNTVILRGVDYPLADDGNFPKTSYLKQIEQTGANAIRIQWYMNYNGTGERAPIADLGRFVDLCVEAGIIPILMLSDETCVGDVSVLNSTVVPWWTSTDTDNPVLATLKARQACLILNLANELGNYHWADDPASALTDYTNAYKKAITSMRAAGYTLPLMIDAPDCGISLDAFTSIGAELIAADPLKNILLSTHAYWAGFDGQQYVAPAVAANLPIVFGEVANKEDETAADGVTTLWCYYDLDGTTQNHATSTGYTYQPFLTSLVTEQVGWLAWCWTNDYCSSRQMSSDGSFANLTAWGNDLVNNATYGLKATAVRYLP